MTTSGAKSRRDRMIVAIAVVVVLYAIAAPLLWFTGRAQAWTIARMSYVRERRTVQREKALIADRDLWEERAETKRLRMPLVGEDEKPATRWERIVERLAAKYHVSVGKGLKAQLEEDHGGVWEMPVEVKYDNTSLLRLVEFLYEVNTAEDALMDVRELEINAARGKNAGALHGKIVLTCAYLKGDEPQDDDSK